MKLEEALKKVRAGGYRLLFDGSPVAENDDEFTATELLFDAWGVEALPVTFHTAVKALYAARSPTLRMRRRDDLARAYYVLDGAFCCVRDGRKVFGHPCLEDYVAEDWLLEGDM